MVEKGGRKANLESGLLASMCVVEVETVPLAWNRRGRRSSRRRSRSVLTVLTVIDGGRSVRSSTVASITTDEKVAESESSGKDRAP